MFQCVSTTNCNLQKGLWFFCFIIGDVHQFVGHTYPLNPRGSHTYIFVVINMRVVFVLVRNVPFIFVISCAVGIQFKLSTVCPPVRTASDGRLDICLLCLIGSLRESTDLHFFIYIFFFKYNLLGAKSGLNAQKSQL